jgi:GTP-binding protein HflX
MTNCLLHNKKNFKITECKILDRHILSLIFLQRAETSYARTGRTGPVSIFTASTFWNVDSPRASKGNWNAWTWGNGDWNRQTYCSRQDILIKDKIKAIDSKWARNAVIGAMVRVALVGYTNVGKSTLMNAIGKWCFCRKQTFATFDTTVRKKVIKNLPFYFLTP